MTFSGQLSPEETFTLIEAYEKFRDTEDHGNMWKNIMDFMEEKGSNKSMKIYKSRWNSLCTNYERKKKDKKKVNVWAYFQAMDKIFGKKTPSKETGKQMKITDFLKPKEKGTDEK